MPLLFKSSPVESQPTSTALRHRGGGRAGQRAAVIQTLLGTAKLNGLDPMSWSRDTLEKLPTWPNSGIDELLPLRFLD